MRFDVRAGLLLIALVSLFVGLISSTFQKSFNGRRLAMTVSPNGDRVATISDDAHLHVVDLNASSWMYQEKDVSERITSPGFTNIETLGYPRQSTWDSWIIKFVTQDKALVVFNHPLYAPNVLVWDLKYRQVRSKLSDYFGGSTCSNGTFLGASPTDDSGSEWSYRILDISTGRVIKEFDLQETISSQFVRTSFSLSGDGSTLVFQRFAEYPSLSRHLDIYDVRQGMLTGATTIDFNVVVVVSKTGKYFFAGQDGKLQLFDQNVDPIGNFGTYSVPQAHFSSDEKLLAFQEKLGAPIKILDIEKRKVISTIEMDEDTLFQFSTVNNNLIVLSAEGELNLRIFDSTDGTLIRKFGIDRRRNFFIYAIGFAFWSLAFGWLYPTRKRRANRKVLEPLPVDEGAGEIPAALSSVLKTPWAIYFIWGLMLVSGAWGIGYSVYVIVNFEPTWQFFNSAMLAFYERAFGFSALCFSLGVAAMALSRAIWFRPELIRFVAIMQMVLLLACDVPAFVFGVASFCLTFSPSVNFYLKQKRNAS